MRNLLAVFLVALAAALWFTPQSAEANHTGVSCGGWGATLCLPYADNSYAVNLIKTTGELTYCYNSRAANYPNFKQDVERVHAHETSVTGVGWREIPGVYQTDTAARDAGCQVWNSMPDVHGCPECGAWVHYLNSPVVVEYNWIHGYLTFDTTIGHEEGHIFGLHEGYRDDVFLSHKGTLGIWYRKLDGSKPGTTTDSPSVMDFGTGVWQWTTADVKFICQNIDRFGERLVACGATPPPPTCIGERVDYGYYDTCRNVWYNESNGFTYNPTEGFWRDANGNPEWCCWVSYDNGETASVYNMWRGVWVWTKATTWEYTDRWTCVTHCIQ